MLLPEKAVRVFSVRTEKAVSGCRCQTLALTSEHVHGRGGGAAVTHRCVIVGEQHDCTDKPVRVSGGCTFSKRQ